MGKTPSSEDWDSALGARPNTVQWMILREGSFMLAGGIVIGLLLAIATGKILSGILYQVGALDPIAFSIAPLLLAGATLLRPGCPPVGRHALVR